MYVCVRCRIFFTRELGRRRKESVGGRIGYETELAKQDETRRGKQQLGARGLGRIQRGC